MPNIETIFTHQFDSGVEGRLGMDERGQLYWNEEPVITEQHVKLDRWVSLAVIVGGASTLVIAIFTVLMYLTPPGSVG